MIVVILCLLALASTVQGGSDVCQLPSQVGPCRAWIPSWFYDADRRQCEKFYYGGCGGNGNRFPTKTSCEQKCASLTSNICQLPRQVGPCLAYIPSWFYDANRQQCEKFVYGGCGGNDNRFSTKTSCEKKCASLASNVCSLPRQVGPCMALMPSWFYDAGRRQCVMFYYGGCGGNGNRFPTKKSCEKKCT